MLALLEQGGELLLQSRSLSSSEAADGAGHDRQAQLQQQQLLAQWPRLVLPEGGKAATTRWAMLCAVVQGESLAAGTFVVVGQSSTGAIHIWRGAVHPDGSTALTDGLGMPLRVESPPARPGSLLVPVELRTDKRRGEGSQQLRFWEEEEDTKERGACSSSGQRRCWILELGAVESGEEDEVEGDFSWRTAASKPRPPCPGLPPDTVGTASSQ